MTKDRDFKTKVRARMAKTGERYTAARAQLEGRCMAPPSVHPETAALVRFSDRSEAMLLGLGGGIGFGYFVFEYRGHAPTFYLMTRCFPQYAYGPGFIAAAAARAGLVLDVVETGSKTAAAEQLRERVARGPVIAWVARPAHMGVMPHVVVVTAIDGDTATVRDPDGERRLDLAELARLRAALPKEKHRLISVLRTEAVDPRAACREAIAACVESLEGRIGPRAMAGNLGLRGLAKWADLVGAAKDRKGWPKVLAAPAHLASALRWGHHWIEEAGTGGGAFRRLYASFLDEAAEITGAKHLRNVAASYRELAGRWTDAAHAMRTAADAPDDGPAIRADLAARVRTILAAEESALAALKPFAAGSSRR